jgi:hypothetical protein
MIASGQNVMRLLTFGSRRPRRPAQVATLRWSEANRRRFFMESEAIAGDAPGAQRDLFQQAGMFSEVTDKDIPDFVRYLSPRNV